LLRRAACLGAGNWFHLFAGLNMARVAYGAIPPMLVVSAVCWRALLSTARRNGLHGRRRSAAPASSSASSFMSL
jgi:hypothetical protein